MASRVFSLTEKANQVLVMANPAAGARRGGDDIRELVDCLNARGLQAGIVTDLDHLLPLVERFQSQGCLRAVVAAGGDGTVAEIVNRIRSDVPITVYPLGTANLLASYLQIERDPAALARMIGDGLAVRLDAGRANGRIFLLMAGCGFDADVVTRLHHRRSGRGISYWTYAKPILDAIRSYQYPDLRVYRELNAQGEPVAAPVSARWAFVVNLPCYAAGLNVAPAAVATDDQLDVCTFGHGSLWHGLRYLSYIKLGLHRQLSDCKIASATRLRIESDQQVPYQLDGDPGGFLPVNIEVVSERLTLLVPRAALAVLALDAPAKSGAGAT